MRWASEATGKPVSHLEIMLMRHGLDELDKGTVTIGSKRHDIRPGEYPEIWESRWVRNVRMIDLVVTAPVEHVRAIAESGKTTVSFGEMIEEMALHFHLDHQSGEGWAREKVKEHCANALKYHRCHCQMATCRATVEADLWESFCESLNRSGSSPLWYIRGLIGRFHENWPASKRRSDATAKLHSDLDAVRITRSEFNRKLHKICTK